MLVYAEHLEALDFPALMAVYAESNGENVQDGCDADVPSAEERFRFYLQHGFFPRPGAKYALWTADGSYAAALRLRPWQDGLLLEGLETAPQLRKKGCAKALVRAVLHDNPGQKFYAHVDKENTASLATLTGCGFAVLLDYAQYTGNSDRLDHLYTLWVSQEVEL